MNIKPIIATDLSMISYSMGILDIGRNETWVKLEELLMENFHKLKKIDFDFVLAGFNHGAQKKGSMKLMKMFVACVVQNYASEGNIKHEDFILAATSVAKDRDKQLTDKTFWELTIRVMMEYIQKDEAVTEDDLDNDYRLDEKKKNVRDRTSHKSNPSLAALCLKLISQNIAEAMS